MGFFSDLFGSSNSSSEANNETNYTDTRRIYGEGAVNAENGSAIFQTSTDNRVFNVLDGGAIGASFGAINKTVDSAFKFGTSALGFADNTVQAALDSNNSALSQAFQSNAQTMNKSIEFAKDAQAKSYAQSSAALGNAKDSLADALKFGSAQTATALNSLASSSNLVKDAYADAKGRGALTDKILMVAIAGALFVAWRSVKG